MPLCGRWRLNCKAMPMHSDRLIFFHAAASHNVNILDPEDHPVYRKRLKNTHPGSGGELFYQYPALEIADIEACIIFKNSYL